MSQDGLVLRSQLAEAGLDTTLSRRELAAKRWQRLASGVYLTSPLPATLPQLYRAALFYGGRGSALCGPTAATIHGLRDAPLCADVHLLLPVQRRRAKTGGIIVHRTSAWPSVVVRQDWPVVPIARAAIEAARWSGSLRDARAVLTAAVSDRRCTIEELEHQLALGGQQGSAHARRALRNTAEGARSAPEAEAADLLAPHVLRGQLPQFLLNPELWLDGELIGIPDLWLPGLGIGHETDSIRHHGSQDNLDATLDRHARFDHHGLLLLHTSPKRLRRTPDGFVTRMLTAAATPQREPARLKIIPKGPLLPVRR